MAGKSKRGGVPAPSNSQTPSPLTVITPVFPRPSAGAFSNIKEKNNMYADKERQRATTAARKLAVGRALDFDHILTTGTNIGKTVRDTFLSQIACDPDECWHWIGPKFTNGYGAFKSRGVDHIAHRVAFEIYNGRTPIGVLMHTCDNRQCVNPSHLIEGTVEANIADKVSKCRSGAPRGIDSGRGKLTDAQVLDIVSRRASGATCKALAAEYGVTSACISVISRRKQRAYVGDELSVTPSGYVEAVVRACCNSDADQTICAAMSLVSDSGKVAKEIKRLLAYGKPLDRHRMKDALGDILSSVAILCDAQGFKIEDVMLSNLHRLDHAIHRDTAAEKAAMEGA